MTHNYTWCYLDVTSSYLVIFPATLPPVCRSRSHHKLYRSVRQQSQVQSNAKTPRWVVFARTVKTEKVKEKLQNQPRKARSEPVTSSCSLAANPPDEVEFWLCRLRVPVVIRLSACLCSCCVFVFCVLDAWLWTKEHGRFGSRGGGGGGGGVQRSNPPPDEEDWSAKQLCYCVSWTFGFCRLPYHIIS